MTKARSAAQVLAGTLPDGASPKSRNGLTDEEAIRAFKQHWQTIGRPRQQKSYLLRNSGKTWTLTAEWDGGEIDSIANLAAEEIGRRTGRRNCRYVLAVMTISGDGTPELVEVDVNVERRGGEYDSLSTFSNVLGALARKLHASSARNEDGKADTSSEQLMRTHKDFIHGLAAGTIVAFAFATGSRKTEFPRLCAAFEDKNTSFETLTHFISDQTNIPVEKTTIAEAYFKLEKIADSFPGKHF